MSDTTPTVWAKAKAEIQHRGWHKGWFYDQNDPKAIAPVCLGGAICVVTTGDPVADMDHRADAALTKLMDRLGMQVAPWNDAPERTLDDVYALLDELDEADR